MSNYIIPQRRIEKYGTETITHSRRNVSFTPPNTPTIRTTILSLRLPSPPPLVRQRRMRDVRDIFRSHLNSPISRNISRNLFDDPPIVGTGTH